MLNALPNFHFFSCGNNYCGEHLGMRYYLGKTKEGEEDCFEAIVWPEPWARDRTPLEEQTRKVFPYTEEGLQQGSAWIAEQYEAGKERWNQSRTAEWGVY